MKDEALRKALEECIELLDRLDAQARDGGGQRREVYLSVETWNAIYVPLRSRALAALRAFAQREAAEKMEEALR